MEIFVYSKIARLISLCVCDCVCVVGSGMRMNQSWRTAQIPTSTALNIPLECTCSLDCKSLSLSKTASIPLSIVNPQKVIVNVGSRIVYTIMFNETTKLILIVFVA